MYAMTNMKYHVALLFNSLLFYGAPAFSMSYMANQRFVCTLQSDNLFKEIYTFKNELRPYVVHRFIGDNELDGLVMVNEKVFRELIEQKNAHRAENHQLRQTIEKILNEQNSLKEANKLQHQYILMLQQYVEWCSRSLKWGAYLLRWYADKRNPQKK